MFQDILEQRLSKYKRQTQIEKLTQFSMKHTSRGAHAPTDATTNTMTNQQPLKTKS